MLARTNNYSQPKHSLTQLLSMENLKKHRSSRGGVVTRRINEINNGIRGDADKDEMMEKINKLKYAMEQLGVAHDEYLETLDEEHDIMGATRWYDEYDISANDVIYRAKRAFEVQAPEDAQPAIQKNVKLQRLQVPKFDSSPKSFFRWKEIFERYLREMDSQTKYDYLFSCTQGKAHEYVANKRSFPEAMAKLEEIFGNKHEILRLLINDIRTMPQVKEGDYGGFENLSFEVNNFRDRLQEMGLDREAENSYILHEIEGKLGKYDLQKWLESCGDYLDLRRVEDLSKWLEKQSRVRNLLHVTPPVKSAESKGKYNYSSRFTKSVPFSSMPTSNDVEPNPVDTSSCSACNQTHDDLTKCIMLPLLPFNERWNLVKEAKACFICLQNGHQRLSCTRTKCQVCRGPHHSLLHNPRILPNYGSRTSEMKQNADNTNILDEGKNTPSSNTNIVSSGYNVDESTCSVMKKEFPVRCFLPVVKVKLRGANREYWSTALLDSGSELNIISRRCCDKLQLTGVPITIRITVAGGVVMQRKTKKVELSVLDALGNETQIDCIVMDEVCGKVLPIGDEIFGHLKAQFKGDVDKLVTGGEVVDFLIGMSTPHFHQQLSMEGETNEMTLIETRFGPTVVGPVPRGYQGNYEKGSIQSNQISVVSENICDFERFDFMEAELAGIKKDCACQQKSDDELKFDEIMKMSWETKDGRLVVKLPWKVDPNTLANNRGQAIARDLKLQQYLERRPEISALFEEQINVMIDNGILRRVNPRVPKRYVPLLGIVDLNKESTKVRVCLDSKSKYKGMSINDALLKGTIEMNDIFKALSRFRAGENAPAGDIKKMFCQIKLSEDDELFHGVIWKGETFVFTRVCFGDKNSAPIADYCMRKIAAEGKTSYPLASAALLEKRYVDDILDAHSDEDHLVKTKKEVDNLLGAFGFEIKAWFSNNVSVGSVTESNKVLGLQWNGVKDELALSKMNSEEADRQLFTKRKVLALIASLWDPLGIFSAYLMKARLIFQSIVRLKPNWDDVIEDVELFQKWEAWLSQMSDCKGLVIGRSLLPSKSLEHFPRCDLVGFSDGSETAYGCVLYLRWASADESKVEIKFIGAKGKVGPINGNTVPRQELCGALTLARLTNSAEGAFKETEIQNLIENKTLFCDSTTVLKWIKSEAIKYRPYVKNKIIEIQDLQPVNNWNYISTHRNRAADLMSKGCDVKDVKAILEGPDVLRMFKTDWVQPITRGDDPSEVEELKKPAVVVNATSGEKPPIDLNRYDDWNKLLRVTAYVMRVGRKYSENSLNKVDDVPVPTEDELRRAKIYWIRIAQAEINCADKQIEKLVPFKDKDGVMRIYGRLKNSSIFDINTIHPILLPPKHRVSELIVKDAHERTYHPGHLRVMAECRKAYWIIGVHQMAKSIGFRCVTCRRWRRSSMEQFMADLPDFRITPGSPFENVSIDYFGPFEIRFGRKQRTKAYGAIITCLTTRAVHLELISDLTTDRFLMGLRRFISIYGQPKVIRSDNGTNFRGAASELRKLLLRWRLDDEDKKSLRDFCANYAIKWTFSTPNASHHNGAVESLIKSVKNALNKVVKERVLTEEEYRTILSEVAACVNSRPLWPPTDGDLDLPPITCHDLLRPAGLNRNPEFMNLSYNPKKRYEYIQGVVDEWWTLWTRHFVPNLQTRSKWFKRRENLAVDDVVLLMDKNISRGKWKLGVVDEVFPGADGMVRSAKVRCSNGTYCRPITKLILLLSKEELNNTEK